MSGVRDLRRNDGWVAAALEPKGPAVAELDKAAEHSRICRDAIQLHQFETAHKHAQALLIFLETERTRVSRRIAAKKAAKAARAVLR
jgi:hypothetical protein